MSRNDPATEELLGLVDGFGALDYDDVLDLTWMRVTADLLGICRDHQPGAGQWRLLGNEPFHTMRETQTVITARLREVSGLEQASVAVLTSIPDPEVLRALQEVVRTQLTDASPYWLAAGGSESMLAISVARAAACAIDEVWGETFLEAFRAFGTVTVTDGEPYPVASRAPQRYLGEFKPTSKPTNLPYRDLRWTPRLRLGTENSRLVDVVIDFGSWGRLAQVGQGTELVLAIGQPNLALDEFAVSYPEEVPVYYNRGPADPEVQAERMLEQIAAAGAAGADVILFSEYALNRPALDVVTAGLSGLRSRPALVVAGLSETTRPGPLPGEEGHNVGPGVDDEPNELHDLAWFCTPGVAPSAPKGDIVPAKTTNAPVVRPPDPVTGKVEKFRRSEGIRTGSEIRIYLSRTMTIAVLICRDAMEEAILREVANIGVNLVLVPAMSPKTTAMIDFLHLARARSQAFAAVANGPARWVSSAVESRPHRQDRQEAATRAEGVFTGPYELNADATVFLPLGSNAAKPLPAPPDATERGFWIFRTASRRLTWHT